MSHFSPTPINGAEAIVIPFWDQSFQCLKKCQCWTNADAKAEFAQYWCWVWLRWNQPLRGILGRLSCKLDIPLLDYDRVFVFANVPADVTLTVRAGVDGREQVVLIASGRGMEDEFEGPVHGRHLESLELQAETTQPCRGEIALCYVGLGSSKARKRMAQCTRRYTPDWPDHLCPVGHEETPRPMLGLFFGIEELETLRRKAQTPLYAPLMEQMRVAARQALADHHPEEFVGPYVLRYETVGNDNFMRPSLLRWTPVVAARTCAFVGLLDGNVELLRFAARCALAMAHCDTWVGGPMENFTGSRWHQRSFLEATYAYSVLQVWDWAGSVLTGEGQAFLRHAICGKALSRIRQDAWEWDYIHHCNQGPLFFRTWLLALLAIRQQWPRAADEIPIVERYLVEAMASYIQDDGGAVEGPSYFGSLYNGMALWALARDRGEPFHEYIRRVMPDRFFRISDYYRVMMSSDPTPPGTYLAVGDSGGGTHRYLSHDMALMMWLATGEPFWESILRDLMVHGLAVLSEECPFWLGLPVLLVLGPEGPEPPRPTLPVFHRLNVVGQLMSCRPSPLGSVRLQFVGGKKHGDHHHEDVGSFILEAAGEELAIDRGILQSYSDTRCNRQGLATAHNLLLPESPDGAEPRQLNPLPESVIPEGEGNEISLHARIDTTAAWGGLFQRHVRSIDSSEPMRFTVTDEAAFDKPCAVSFNVHSRALIRATTEGWRIAGKHVTLIIVPHWTPVRAEIMEEGVDSFGQPVNRLRLVAVAATGHRLETELRIESAIQPEGDHDKIWKGE